MLFVIIFFLLLPFVTNREAEAANTKKTIYDFAGLLNKDEVQQLEEISNKYSSERETDFIILTTNDTKGKDIVKYMQDFYDENALGYDKPHGNTAILTIDMQHRDVYLAGFYKAKKYLDDSRLDLIREKITPDLSDGNYYDAFETFIKTSYKYMGFEPGVNPDNILFNIWFQILSSIGIAGIVVGIMLYNTGGKVTINARTYEDTNTSEVLQRKDQYIRTSISKQKIQKNDNNGGGGGGGTSSGGHSHSGSRGSF